MSAKNTPVTCSHTTLENRTMGVTSELLACVAAVFTVFVSGMRLGPAAARVSTGWLEGRGATGLAVGFGVFTASTACASVFAACRAPYPSALPNFTRSMTLVYVVVTSSCRKTNCEDLTSKLL